MASVSWVPLGPPHSDDIWELIRAIENRDGSSFRTSLTEVESYFDPAYLWQASGIRGPQGELIAFGLSRMPRLHGEIADVTISGGVHPNYRDLGLGHELLLKQLATAERLAQGQVRDGSAVIHVDSGRQDLMELVIAEGFSSTFSYVQMRRKLGTPVTNVKIPSYITIEQLRPDLDEEVRRAHNEIYLELAGHDAMSPERWFAEHAFLNRSWSFVALDRRGDRPRLAGYILSAKYEQEWEEIGWSEGYVEEVAVRDEWRGLNLLTVLLSSAMHAYEADGIEYVGLDVSIDPNAEDPEGRVQLFTNFQFEKTVETIVLAKPLTIEDLQA